MKKRNYKCKVDGVVGRVGKCIGICPKSVVNGYCGAHGNTKCEHKEKLNKDAK